MLGYLEDRNFVEEYDPFHIYDTEQYDASQDGNNALLKNGPIPDRTPFTTGGNALPPVPVYTIEDLSAVTSVPFTRIMRLGTKGRDVKAVKRALAKFGYDHGVLVNKYGYGNQIKAEVARFQRAHGLKQDGQYGPKTHQKLVAAQGFDKYGKWLMQEAFKNLHPHQKSGPQQVMDAAFTGYHNRAAMNYTEGPLRWNGIDNKRIPPRFPTWADCSSYYTWCDWTVYGGGSDYINGEKWQAGYTGTMADHGKTVVGGHLNAKVNDAFLYGYRPDPGTIITTHVARYVGNGRVISHGSQGGPYLLNWNYRGDLVLVKRYL